MVRIGRALMLVFLGQLVFASTTTRIREVQLGVAASLMGSLYAVENEYCIFLEEIAGLSTPIIHVLDLVRKSVVTVQILQQIQGATDLSVYDVSIGRSGVFAVSVVATNDTPHDASAESMESLLMVYSPSGQLLNATKLTPGTHPSRLKVDDDDTIWAVGNSSGEGDPATVPMFYRYSDYGRTSVGLFPRSEFRGSETKTRSLAKTAGYAGALNFGITSAHVWCWFPQNQELVVFEKSGTNLRRILTGLPDRSATSDLIRIDTLGFVEPGWVVCLATSRVPARRAVDALLYRLDVIPRSWQRIQHPGIENHKSRFLGVDKGRLVFAENPENLLIAWEEMPLP